MEIPSQKKKNKFFTEQKNLKSTRSLKKMDAGIVGNEELKWLEEDVNETNKDKIIVFTHNPIFSFSYEERDYDIENRENVLKIMKKIKKDFVCISGDSHIWYEETKDKIHYFIINAYLDNQSYAIFTWDENGYRIEKYKKN